MLTTCLQHSGVLRAQESGPWGYPPPRPAPSLEKVVGTDFREKRRGSGHPQCSPLDLGSIRECQPRRLSPREGLGRDPREGPPHKPRGPHRLAARHDGRSLLGPGLDELCPVTCV